MFRSMGSLIFLLTIGFLSCSENQKMPDPALDAVTLDISPSVELDHSSLTAHSLFKVTYHWKTGPQFKTPDLPLIVKVHFVSPKGEILWQDDHEALPACTEWTADKEYRYQRIVYVPLIVKPYQVNMLLGLYSPGLQNRWYLNGIPLTKDYYQVAQLSVSPPTDAKGLPDALIEYTQGWHGIERDLKSKVSWRWMAENAICELKNPHRNAVLFIRGWLPTEHLGQPSTIQLLFGQTELARYDNQENEFEILIPISETHFSGKESQPLQIQTGASYVPAEIGKSSDTRRLGAMIKLLYFN